MQGAGLIVYDRGMKVVQLIRMRDRKPFLPFVIELTSGSLLRVDHPENFFVADDVGAVRLRSGKGVIFFPSEICSIRPVENGRRNGR